MGIFTDPINTVFAELFNLAQDVIDKHLKRFMIGKNDLEYVLDDLKLEEINTGITRIVSFTRKAACQCFTPVGTSSINHCTICEGTQLIEKTENLKIKIPIGKRDYDKLKVSGYGNTDIVGNVGNLLITIITKHHRLFEITNRHDLLASYAISTQEAVEGTKIKLKTIHGTKITLNVKPLTNNPGKLRIAGHGLKINATQSGDLYLQIVVNVLDNSGHFYNELKKSAYYGNIYFNYLTPRKAII